MNIMFKWLNKYFTKLIFDDLLDCPGCQNKPTIRSISQQTDFWVYCIRDHCKYFEKGLGPFNSEDESVKAWNKAINKYNKKLTRIEYHATKKMYSI